MTTQELLALFHRSVDDAQTLAAADSQEYLAVVTYLVARNVRGRGNV